MTAASPWTHVTRAAAALAAGMGVGCLVAAAVLRIGFPHHMVGDHTAPVRQRRPAEATGP
ncbi:hypothetical protein [Streptomyces sp. NPDC047061]|uniref:hypothetical protein n=1 Tax=Streptomyces sp. NPDC047061 TaxID=3154605 RepID=UPI0033E9EAEA